MGILGKLFRDLQRLIAGEKDPKHKNQLEPKAGTPVHRESEKLKPTVDSETTTTTPPVSSPNKSPAQGPRGRPPLRGENGQEDWLRTLDISARETTQPVKSPNQTKRISPSGRVKPISPTARSSLDPDSRSRSTSLPTTKNRQSERRPEITVRIGIDFGTSFSKMAIGANGKVYIVDWSGLARLDDPYLLPSAIKIDGKGSLSATRGARAAGTRVGLKLPFIEDTATAEDEALLVGYLAILMKYAREWLQLHHKSWLDSTTPRWEVNLGIPAGSWNEKPTLNKVFQRLGYVAWELSRLSSMTLSDARTLIAKNEQGRIPDGLEALNVVPEFCAQVAGYQNSPQRVEGMHLLVDIGGGTLDIACFYVHNAQGTYRENLAVYSASVDPFGTHFLTKKRFIAAGASGEDVAPSTLIPSAAAFASKYSVGVSVIVRADLELQGRVSKLVHAALVDGRRHLRMGGVRRSPLERERVKVFVSGGGADLAPYRSAVADALKRIDFDALVDPLPENANTEWAPDVSQCSFDRVSVAAGLTEDLESLRLYRPTEIDPIELTRRTERVSHEDMYDD